MDPGRPGGFSKFRDETFTMSAWAEITFQLDPANKTISKGLNFTDDFYELLRKSKKIVEHRKKVRALLLSAINEIESGFASCWIIYGIDGVPVRISCWNRSLDCSWDFDWKFRSKKLVELVVRIDSGTCLRSDNIVWDGTKSNLIIIRILHSQYSINLPSN